jgi:hypothetical protein
MNILMYAENYIFKVASAPHGEGVTDSNREIMYQLYNFALQLEPDKKPELTFSERMLVTFRMRKRMEVRAIKKGKKD